jgi:parallel beta-helix repeat protein
MGVHVTESSVTARGNMITGAWLDKEKDMGDAFYAIESTLVIERNVMRGNAGSGVTAVRSKVRLSDNGFIENGRAGMLLLDSSRSDASGNTFERNAMAAVELGERSRATLSQNRFSGNVRLDIDAGCGKGLAGTADIGDGNTFAAPMRQRVCAE